MKKILLVLIVLLSYTYNIHPSPGWFSQNSSVNKTFFDVYFINELTGWAVGDTGIIVKTTNGGINWFQQYDPNNIDLLAVRFINENIGWAVGGEYYYNPFNVEYAVIIKTTNGGTNWVIQFSTATGNRFYDLSVTDSNTAYATHFGSDISGFVSSGGIFKTTNGGINWYGISDPNLGMNYGYKTIDFINQTTGWSMGLYTSCTMSMRRIIKTTNRGLNWSIIRQDSASLGMVNMYFSQMRFFDTLNGYLLDGCLKRTTDGGYNWINTDSTSTRLSQGYFFVNNDTGWIVGHNSIKRTDNGGINWSSQNTSSVATLNSVYFINKNTGWVVGSNGTILKTITGGLTSVKQISTLIPEKSSLLQNYTNPFNPVTTITYNISSSGDVDLKVFDISGREITTLVNENQTPGKYEIAFDATSMPSGVYFYKLQAGDFVETRKMVVLK